MQQASTEAAPDTDVTARRLPGTGYPPQRTQAEAAESPGKATPGTRVEAAHCPPVTLTQAAPPSGTVKQAGDITVLQSPDLRPGPADHITRPDRPLLAAIGAYLRVSDLRARGLAVLSGQGGFRSPATGRWRLLGWMPGRPG
jgi:hypothetical protein